MTRASGESLLCLSMTYFRCLWQIIPFFFLLKENIESEKQPNPISVSQAALKRERKLHTKAFIKFILFRFSRLSVIKTPVLYLRDFWKILRVQEGILCLKSCIRFNGCGINLKEFRQLLIHRPAVRYTQTCGIPSFYHAHFLPTWILQNISAHVK